MLLVNPPVRIPRLNPYKYPMVEEIAININADRTSNNILRFLIVMYGRTVWGGDLERVVGDFGMEYTPF
jgi:hypothetical protein